MKAFINAFIKFVVGACGLAIVGFAIIGPDSIGKAIGFVFLLTIIIGLIQGFFDKEWLHSSDSFGKAFLLAVIIVIIIWWIFFR